MCIRDRLCDARRCRSVDRDETDRHGTRTHRPRLAAPRRPCRPSNRNAPRQTLLRRRPPSPPRHRILIRHLGTFLFCRQLGTLLRRHLSSNLNLLPTCRTRNNRRTTDANDPHYLINRETRSSHFAENGLSLRWLHGSKLGK